MEINADFSERVLLHTPLLEWQDSPMKGVRRRMLDRVGEEVARATSIVSYAPESHFSSHVHTGGEEFIVLEGVFQDEHDDFPAGSYIRNPPGSSHTPGSEPGCVIFVKLWQFDLADRTLVQVDMNSAAIKPDGMRTGVSVATLYSDSRETVTLEQWEPHSSVSIDASGGAEILVLDGAFIENGDSVQTLSWMRLPAGYVFEAQTSGNGARVWVKTGHISHAKDEVNRLPL